MKNSFVQLKSQLTFAKELYEAIELKTYRVRTECKCAAGQNMRDGILVLSHEGDIVLTKVIRCRGCVTRKEGRL